MKKIVKYFISIIVFVCMFSITSVYAETKNLELVDVKVQSKTASITVEDVALNGNTVTSKIAFNKVNDFVAFELKIKNNDAEEYKVISVEDNNKSENLEISYIYDDNYIKKDETTSVTVKFKYAKELLDKEKISLDNLNIKINFEKSDGKTSEVVVNPTPSISINPTTGVPLLRYILLAIFSTIGLVLVLTKKNKKIGTALLVMSIVAIPFSVIANEKFEISLKFSSIEVIGKEQVPPPTTATLVEGGDISSFTHNKEGAFRKATLEEYNSIKDSLTEENIISTEDSEKIVYIWDIESGTVYYSEADIIYMNENSSYMFTETNYTSIDLTGLDSSKVTTMKGMFDCNSLLTTLDITSFDTTNVTDMSTMFSNTNLEEIDLSTFNTSNVTDMSKMFADNQNLRTIYVFDEWNTNNVTNFDEMFESNWVLIGEKVTAYDWESSYNSSWENPLDPASYAHVDGGEDNPGFLTLKGHVKDFSILLRGEYGFDEKNYYIAGEAKNFRKATLEEYNLVKDTLTDENIVSDEYSPIPTYMWTSGDDAIYYSTASIIYINASASSMFESSTYESINLNGLDSTKVLYMERFVRSSQNLKRIVFGDFDTSNVTTMYEMFEDCYELEELDLSTFDTSKVTNTGYMFDDCESLGTIYVSDKWDLSNVEESYNMFGHTYNITGEKMTVYDSEHTELEYAHVDGGEDNPGYLTLKGHTKDFSVVIKGEDFNNIIKSMDTDNKDFRKATTSEYNLVKDSLTTDNIVSIKGSPIIYMWETDNNVLYYSEVSKVFLNNDSQNLFYDTNLKTIDMSDIYTINVSNAYSMFEYCPKLTTIYVSETWDMSNVSDGWYMFNGTYNILGEKGTTYDENNTGETYAHVDEGASNPGYLTLKGHVKDFALLLSGNDFNQKIYNLDTNEKEFRKATTSEYNLVKDTLTANDIISASNSPYNIYIWETNDSVLYYSNVSTIYLYKDSEEMFSYTNFKVIDLSDFDISYVTDMEDMFKYCEKLTTIYVSETWDMSNVEYIGYMFGDTYNLVGEEKTVYDLYHTDGDYGHVDEGPSNPGYFTLKGHTKNFAFLLSGDDFNQKIYNLDTNEKEFRKATAAEYNDKKNYLTNSNIISAYKSPIEVYMWETSNSVLYYSTASEILLDSDSSDMFNSTGLKTIDISGFNTTNITDTSYMFSSCVNLISIYVSDTLDMSNVQYSYDMFYGLDNIIGEQLTTYDFNHTELEYAHVDEGPSNPGYFTLKGHKADVAFTIDGYDLNSKLHSMETYNKDFRKATTAEYNLVKNSLTEDNEISIVYSPYKVYMWETDNDVLYYSEASNIYLNENCSEFFEYQGFKTIDLSGFNTSHVGFVEYMFGNCENLTTIYVSNTWDASNIEYESSMFYGSENIVGGNGTVYDEDKIDSTYAHIDGGPSNPGYFTDIADKN